MDEKANSNNPTDLASNLKTATFPPFNHLQIIQSIQQTHPDVDIYFWLRIIMDLFIYYFDKYIWNILFIMNSKLSVGSIACKSSMQFQIVDKTTSDIAFIILIAQSVINLNNFNFKTTSDIALIILIALSIIIVSIIKQHYILITQSVIILK